MNKLNKNNIFNIVFSVIFIGVVLSFSIFFWMTGTIRPSENVESEYFDNAPMAKGYFSKYNDLCLKNKRFYSMIVETEYRIFGNIRQGNVIKGKDGFLFAAGENKYKYDYIVDYVGGYQLDEQMLENLYQNIELRRKVYESQGREYILAVIPNSQTVYSDCMPEYLGNISNNTVLSQLSQYMESKGNVNFIDLTYALNSAKSGGLLYNNTENSINALGAYYVYNGIMQSIPETLSLSERTLPLSAFNYYTHYTEGKTLADLAGLASMLKNETVSISNDTEFMYSIINFHKEFETTYVKFSYRDRVPMNPSVLIEITNEWDKIQLMPYFSNTFGVSSYKTDHKYSKETVENSNPLLVIQILHEDELMMLLNKENEISYSAALGDDSTVYKTRAPQSIAYTVLDDNSVCISGMVEGDAEVQIFGNGLDTRIIRGLDGQFFARIDFEDDVQGKEVFINAKSSDKAASDLITLIISGTNNVGSAREVFVGENSMLYKLDYGIMYDLPDGELLSALETELDDLFAGYSQAGGKDIEVFFAMIPEKLSVYTYESDTNMNEQFERLEAIKSCISGIISNVGGVSVDLADVLFEKRNSGKLFYQTDNDPTDIAYYYMYQELIRRLSEKFPSMSPVGIDNFVEYSYPYKNGSLASALGFDMSKLSERVTKFKFTNNAEYVTMSNGAILSYRFNEKLPNAVVIYDEKGAPLIDLLAEHFNVMYVLPKNSFELQDEALSKVRPDCIIYLCSEGKIDFNLR